jgi:predicted aspartyl protease
MRPQAGLARFRTLLIQALALAFATPALAQAPQTVPPSMPQKAAETAIATARLDADRMTVAVTIDGAGPFRFIVDTGAERTVIARELADELRLHSAGQRGLLSMTTVRDAPTVDVPKLSFMPGDRRDLRAFALGGSDIAASGILGIDALREQRVVFDFANSSLSVGPAPDDPEPVYGDEIVVHGHGRFGELVLADSNVDGVPVDVIIDSGSQASVGNDALRSILMARQSFASFQHITLVSVTGETLSADYTRTSRLVIGKVALNGMPVAFADAPIFSRLRLTHRPALLLGMDALQMFARVSVDFPNRNARFVPPRNAEHVSEPP